MSAAAKGKALLALLLFGLLFAAVTMFPGRGPEDARGADGPSQPARQADAHEAASRDTTDASVGGRSEDGAAERGGVEPVGTSDGGSILHGAGPSRTPASPPTATYENRAQPASNPRSGSGYGPGGETDGNLSAVDRGRAEHAANDFVVYAYGYTGDDIEQYRSYVNQAVVPESFANSPGAARVEEFARRVKTKGTESHVIPESVKISPVDDGGAADGAIARVTFRLTDPSGQTLLTQTLRVVSLGDVWRVAEAGELREVDG